MLNYEVSKPIGLPNTSEIQQKARFNIPNLRTMDLHILYKYYLYIYMSYRQNLVLGEGTSQSRVAHIGVAEAARCTNPPEGIVLGWAPIGFAAMGMLVGVVWE